MTDEASHGGGSIRRVVVLVDASRVSRAALEEAADLAARRQAELLGLFVEEEALLRSAGLPFAREIGPTSAALRPLDPRRVERRLRAQARELDRLLAELAHRYAISGSLRVARGNVVNQALAHALPGDLLVVGRTGWSPVQRGRVGSTPRSLIREGPLAVMVHGGAAGGHTTTALLDSLEAGPEVLAMAAQLAIRDEQALTVFLPPEEEGGADRLRHLAEDWLEDRGLQATYRTLPSASTEAVARAVRNESGRALVISRRSPFVAPDGGEGLIRAVAPPVVVVP